MFISDLHVGVGKDPVTNEWLPAEDFRWSAEFKLFLDAMNRQGSGKTDLIIVGDFLELWQSITHPCIQVNEKGNIACVGQDGNPDKAALSWLRRMLCQDNEACSDDVVLSRYSEQACRHKDRDLGCNEKEVLARANRVFSQHDDVFEAIGRFAASGDNQVTILAGNHDAALLFPAVRGALIEAIGAPEGRVSMPESAYWLSSDSRIYAEHGQQVPDDVNSWEDDWPTPFIEKDGTTYLRRPWGEQFVQNFYNDWEEKYPVIDNILKETAGVKYGVAAEGNAVALATVGDFLKFYFFDVSLKQLSQSLGSTDKEVKWDIPYIRKDLGDRFIVESLPSDHPAHQAAESARERRELPITVIPEHASESKLLLSDEEISEICDRRASIMASQAKAGIANTITECPRKQATLRAVAGNILRWRDLRFQQHLKRTWERLAKDNQAKERFKVFVFGHTHEADSGFRPFNGRWQPLVVNTGAWQRVISPKDLEALKDTDRYKNLSDGEFFRRLRPEDLPPRYSYVVVKPYANDPVAKLCWWVKNINGWEIEGTECGK